MTFETLFTLALGLATDAAAVAAALGLAAARGTPRRPVGAMLRVALCFGGFQAGMPLLGGLLGSLVGSAMAEWDHWIAFVLLLLLGLHMLREALTGGDDEVEAAEPSLMRLASLGVATSIDALAVGATLPSLGVALGPAVALIGGVTAVLCAATWALGRRFGHALGRRLAALGGVALIAVGTQILLTG